MGVPERKDALARVYVKDQWAADPSKVSKIWEIWRNDRWNPITLVQIASKAVNDDLEWSLDYKPVVKSSLSTVAARPVRIIRVESLKSAPKGKSLQELLQAQADKEAKINATYNTEKGGNGGLAVPEKELMSLHSPRDGISMDELKAPTEEAILVPISTIGPEEKGGIRARITPRVESMGPVRQFSVQQGVDLGIEDDDADMRDMEPELPPTPRTPFDPSIFPDGDPEVSVRISNPRDIFQIKRMHAKAFNDPQESVFIDTLTKARQILKQFVAILPSKRSDGGEIIAGAISYVEVRVEKTMRGQTVKGICLKRLAVHPMYQRRGIGKALMKTSLTEIQLEGYDYVIVLGHTSYYTKFGFESAQSWGLTTDYKADEAFLALEITPHVRKKIFGGVQLWPRWGKKKITRQY